jgi:hypothetical protein
MKFNKYLFYVILSLFLHLTGVAQQNAIPFISEKNLKQHVMYLASDSLQGRGFFTEIPGLDLAADYIRRQIEKTEPGFAGESYSQTFNLYVNRLDEENTFLKIFNEKEKELTCRTQIAVFNQVSDTVNFSGEPVFIGFGLKDEQNGYNDLEGLDLKNKIVILSAGTPESFRNGFSHQWNNPQERKKTEEIFEAGAKAIILVTSPQDEINSTFNQMSRWTEHPRFSLEKIYQSDQSNLIITTPEVADAFMGRKGSWKKMLKSISRSGKPNSFPIKNRIVQVMSSRVTETLETQNVVGLIEGSDSLLKEECVVIMAHYDHLGMDRKGEIFNGADDNASGAAVLIEEARAFSASGNKPKRSVVFLWTTAEETGLLGSEYYSRNPVFPLSKTVVCINLDMVGRVYEPRDSVWSHSPKQVKDFDGIYALVNDFNPELKEITTIVCNRLGLLPDFSLPATFFRTSDHYHFHHNRVPVLNLSTGYTADYHKVTDVPERIRFDKMRRVAELTFLTGFEMANQ